ncbi:MAG: hypothetical protein DCC58_14500 [Chloroflexi bacterium]|nr:MAG: hypothetical protein DCC58_14500 [Chloroflexota bacterium]
MDDRRFDDLTRVVARATSRRQVLKAILGVAAAGVLGRAVQPQRVRAQPAGRIVPANSAFLRTWERTDRPVAEGRATRTWMWGPEPFTEALMEPYAESPGGMRQVQYYDKSRMEITDPGADQNSVWYVTNGLLVNELMTGQMQTGHTSFEQRSPAQVNVAGDSDDPDGPTYATFAGVRNLSTGGPGAVITRTITRGGTVGNNPALAQHNVTEAQFTSETNHWIAAPFWAFMNSSGTVYENGQFNTAALFLNAYYATGFPVTDAYWARVRVGGTQKDVLAQCFERRCLTYTPDNPPEWRVEMGNVGRHYHAWRTGGGSDQTTIGEASASVEAQLESAAGQNAAYQQLETYVRGLGYIPDDQRAFTITESGAQGGAALVASYREVHEPPGRADIYFDQASGPYAGPFAIIRNADESIAFSAFVGDSGQIEIAQPSIPLNQAELAAREVEPRATPSCNACIARCNTVIAQSSMSLEDICLLTSYLTCSTLILPTKKGFQSCVIGSWAGCILSGGSSTCAGLCTAECQDPCDACRAGRTCCGEHCWDLNTSLHACGSCNVQCPAYSDCWDGVCISVRTDPQNCGGHGIVCAANEICENGTCRKTCSPACQKPLECCDGVCVNLSSDPHNCYHCGRVCPEGAPYCINTVCESRNCDPVCEPPLFCCGGDCVDVFYDRENCGACQNQCLDTCCNGECASLDIDSANCGRCGNVCPSGETCCSGHCVDLKTNESYCGSCSRQCLGWETCCDGQCKDISDDEANCGGCGKRCPADYTCCHDTCKDLYRDRNNCGTCGRQCGPNELCDNGQCVSENACENDSQCSGTDVCYQGECVSCASRGGTGCADYCCPSGYPNCCSAVDTCCPAGFPVCPPAGRNFCCPAGSYLCSNYDRCCPDGCTCTADGCNCNTCENHSDCTGTDVCIGGQCVSCTSAGGSPCMGDFCCGGDYPVCCGGVAQCCPAAYPVCPYPGSNWCCAAGYFPCTDGVTCCPTGCTCHSGGCNCPNDIQPEASNRAMGRGGPEITPALLDISITPAEPYRL